MTHCLNHYPLWALWVPNTLESPLILIRILSPQKWTKVTGGCGQEEINSISVWRYPHDLSQLRLVILTSVQYIFHRLSSPVSLSCVCGRCFLRITNSDVPDKKQQDQKRNKTSLFLFLLCRHEGSVFAQICLLFTERVRFWQKSHSGEIAPQCNTSAPLADLRNKETFIWERSRTALHKKTGKLC